MRRLLVLGMILLLVLTALAGCRPRQQANAKSAEDIGISVRTASARVGSMASVVEVSGEIKALKSAVLSAKIPGRVTSVPYREGDSVRAGATVVQQDTSDLRAQFQQAEAGLLAARARLSQAVTSAGVSDTQVEAGVAQAQAGLEAARANLRLIKKGARSQEVATVESAVISAEASYKHAKANFDRMNSLYSEGALSRQQMDLAQMQYDVAKAQYDSAKQQLSLVKEGAREEQIEAAEKQVQQAEEGLRIAKSNRGNTDLRQEDIKSAKAGVAQAEAGLAYARQQLANASIAAPIAGTVSKRMVEPGEMANPGTPLIEVVAMGSIYFEATVSEIDIYKIKVGQSVGLSIDALSGKKFRGSVLKILPTADSNSRHFIVRIQVENKTGELKPGMFARGNVEVARHDSVVIIPKDALVANGEGKSVYVVTGGKAKFVPVMTGFETREEVEILSGVSAGEQIVTAGQDKVSDGVKVNASN